MNLFSKAAIVLVATLAASASAWAGDFASFQPLGFSPDGKVFAFEEFGVEDGSGFPYSSIYFIDTEGDAFLPGTPVRVRLDEDGADIGRARTLSRGKAEALIGKHSIASNPGILAAFNPMGEVVADGHRIAYHQHAVEPAPGGAFALALQEIPLPETERCRDVTPDGGRGFRLTLVKRDGAPADQVVHEDTRLPESRNCPLSYQISGALTFQPPAGDPVHVALVLVRSVGFEGSNGRWLAVPFRP